MASEVAERYAEGLFSLALEDHTAASKKQQAEELSEVLAESDDLLLFLRAVKITPEEKKKIEELKEVNIMTAKERMIWLSEVVQGIQTEKEVVVNGAEVQIKEVEANLMTKLKAIDTLNKMSGEYTTKIEGNIGVTKLEDLL